MTKHNQRVVQREGSWVVKTKRSDKVASLHSIILRVLLVSLIATGTLGLCCPASAAPLLRWKTNDYAVVLDGNTVLNGKNVGMEGTGITGLGASFNVSVREWDPFYKLFWAGDDDITTIKLSQQPGDNTLYRNTDQGEIWAASGGDETEGEVYFENVIRSGFLYTTDTKASVTITNIKVEGEAKTGKKGVFDAKVGGEFNQKTVRVSRTLEATDPTVSVRVVFPTESFLESYFGSSSEPADDFPFNYDTVLSASPSDVSLTPPSGWDVYFDSTGTQNISGLIVDDATPFRDVGLSYASILDIGSMIPFVLLSKIVDGTSVEYYNFDPLGFQVVPEPSTLALMGIGLFGLLRSLASVARMERSRTRVRRNAPAVLPHDGSSMDSLA